MNNTTEPDSSSGLSQSELKALGPRPISLEATKALLDPNWGNANKLDVDEPLLK